MDGIKTGGHTWGEDMGRKPKIPKKSKPTQTGAGIRSKEKRPKFDEFYNLVDEGCPKYKHCLEKAALRNLNCVPCEDCPCNEEESFWEK